MILYIIKWTFIYVILIFLLHNLYLFFQNNLTSTKIKDYYNTYNTYNSYNSDSNNMQIKNITHEKKTSFVNNLQINSTSLEELNKYSEFTNNNGLINDTNDLINDNNGLTNDMKSELNDFFNKLKL
jgi:hypothetical protein